MPAPAELLCYRDETVIDAFVATWGGPRSDAVALFGDVVAWLWLLARPDAPALAIDDALAAIDEMWHVYLLHTERYAHFCATQLGRFVHHVPIAPPANTPAPPPREGDRLDAGRAQAAFIARELGVGRLLRWYVELPRRYDDAWFRTARRHQPVRYEPTPALIAQWETWHARTMGTHG